MRKNLGYLIIIAIGIIGGVGMIFRSDALNKKNISNENPCVVLF